MTRQVVSADTLSKTKTKSDGKPKKKVDLKKVAKVIVENKDTIEAVAASLGTLLNSSNSSKKSSSASKKTSAKKTGTKTTTKTKRKTTTKSKKSSSKDTVSTLVDMFLK